MDERISRQGSVASLEGGTENAAPQWSGYVSRGEFKQSLDKTILPSDIFTADSSDLTFS